MLVIFSRFEPSSTAGRSPVARAIIYSEWVRISWTCMTAADPPIAKRDVRVQMAPRYPGAGMRMKRESFL